MLAKDKLRSAEENASFATDIQLSRLRSGVIVKVALEMPET